MEIAYGRGGWVRVGELGDRTDLFVRFMDNGAVGEMFIAASNAPEGITAADLRGIPLARIAAVALSNAELFGPERRGDPDIWSKLGQMVPHENYGPRVNVRLKPPTHGLDDQFLRRVADAYLSAVGRGERPNRALADQVGHQKTRTVERWVYLARKRGYLAKTPQGGSK